ncbi:hypothetical protein BH11PAT1_BH11PAT1_7310 [soil metagenome]
MYKKFYTLFHISTKWLIIVIFIGGVILRFIYTPERFGFDKDPTRDVLVAHYAAQHLQFPLIGPPSGIGPFTFGPWYYYQIILFTLVFPFSFAPFYYIPLFSLLLIIIMYYIGREIHDELLGIILATFVALSPSFIASTAALSNPSLIPTISGLCLLLFLLIWKKSSLRLLFLWGIIIAIGINIHYEMIPMLLFPVLFFTLQKKIISREACVFLCGLFFPCIPFIYYNYAHNWQSILGFIEFIHGGGTNNYIPNNWRIYLFQFWPRYFAYIFSINSFLSIIAAIIIFSIYLYKLVNKSIKVQTILLLLSFSIFFLGLRYFNASREYYYFLFLEPLLIIIVGIALYYISNIKFGKVVVLLIMILFSILALYQNSKILRQNGEQQYARELTIELEKETSNALITIYNCRQESIQRAMGVVFLLEKDNYLATNGHKIGFSNATNESCTVPLRAIVISNGVFDFKNISSHELAQLGWHTISPKSVFEAVTSGSSNY